MYLFRTIREEHSTVDHPSPDSITSVGGIYYLSLSLSWKLEKHEKESDPLPVARLMV